MNKVLIPTKLDKICRQILEETGDYVVIQDETLNLEALPAEHRDAFALIVRSEKVNEKVIDALPKLKIIIRAGAGFNTIATKYAREKGIDVLTTPGANSNAVAEEVVALMLADARHIVKADASARAGQWEKKAFMGREIAGKTIGIVGLGNVGRLLARRLSGFEVKVLGFDIGISPDRAQEFGAKLVDLDTLFKESDYISLHLPENETTRNLVSTRYLSLMKAGATLINTARSGIIDEAALREARKTKNIRFLNDVYPKDAEGPKSVTDIADIMLPHLGASTAEANYKAAQRAAEELIELDAKGITTYIVNRDIPAGLDSESCELANLLARFARGMTGSGFSPRLLETSFYGTLEPFADWLLIPIVAGLWDDFDRSRDAAAAKQFLEEKGIDTVNRKVDTRKGYGNSITIDITGDVGAGVLRRISLRGTVAEGRPMIARINDFDRLYFTPSGHTALFIYKDRPGVVGTVGVELGNAGININEFRSPLNTTMDRSLIILKADKAIPDPILQHISGKIEADAAFSIKV